MVILKIECQSCEDIQTVEAEGCFVIVRRNDGAYGLFSHHMDLPDYREAILILMEQWNNTKK